MIINKEKIKKELINTYKECGFDSNYDLCELIIDNFLERLEDYEKDEYLENIINDITGNYDGSYTCNYYDSVQLIAENIFEFIDIVSEIQANINLKIDITEPEKSLVCVLLYICDLTILNQGCNTLGELIKKIS